MKKTTLEASGLTVSRICVGCWSFGGGADSYWGEQPQREVDALVSRALDLGVNFFDTAFGYNGGESERALGRALGQRRREAVICDKTPIISREQLPDCEDIIAAGLKRLGTDYLDLLMIHWPTKDEDLLAENLLALDKLRQKGTIRALGVSNFGLGTLGVARSLGIPVAANEIAYSLLLRAIEHEILPYCREQNIGVAAYMPLMQGILTGKYAVVEDIPPERRRSVHFDSAKNPKIRHGGSGFEAETMAAVRGICGLAAELGIGAGTLALAWTLAQPGVATAMVGCRNAEQVEENTRAADFTLSPEILARLNALTRPLYQLLPKNPDPFMQGEEARIW